MCSVPSSGGWSFLLRALRLGERRRPLYHEAIISDDDEDLASSSSVYSRAREAQRAKVSARGVHRDGPQQERAASAGAVGATGTSHEEGAAARTHAPGPPTVASDVAAAQSATPPTAPATPTPSATVPGCCLDAAVSNADCRAEDSTSTSGHCRIPNSYPPACSAAKGEKYSEWRRAL